MINIYFAYSPFAFAVNGFVSQKLESIYEHDKFQEYTVSEHMIGGGGGFRCPSPRIISLTTAYNGQILINI